MERLESLGINNLKIYQDDELYCFTSDAVRLSEFAAVKKGDVVADFCSGSGIVGLHLYALNPVIKSVTLFEMQKPLFMLSEKTIAVNGLEKIFEAKNKKIQDIGSEYNEKFSLIVCNPPYMQEGSGETRKSDGIAVCRSEITLTLAELLSAAAKSLKFGGRLNIVHRSDRLADVICGLRGCNLEPKKIQFISGGGKAPYLFMAEAVKGGKAGLKVLPTVNN